MYAQGAAAEQDGLTGKKTIVSYGSVCKEVITGTTTHVNFNTLQNHANKYWALGSKNTKATVPKRKVGDIQSWFKGGKASKEDETIWTKRNATALNPDPMPEEPSSDKP